MLDTLPKKDELKKGVMGCGSAETLSLVERRLGRVCRDAAKTSPNLPQHLSARALHKQASIHTDRDSGDLQATIIGAGHHLANRPRQPLARQTCHWIFLSACGEHIAIRVQADGMPTYHD